MPLAIWPVLAGAAAIAPTTLTMQSIAARTIHLAGDEGANNRRHSADIRVELLAQNKLRAVDSGERYENNLYRDFSTQDQTKWTNSWRGSWAVAGDGLRLHLMLVDRKCQRTKTMRGQTKEMLACPSIGKELRFDCRSVEITTEQWVGPDDKPQRKKEQHAAWRCQTNDPFDFADTPSQWVLGKSVCLKVVGDMEFSYETCAAK